ncbi:MULTISPECIES: DUF397 domain-containing protein [unclassified Streptomyces]|uniref:DUF397 domain-containing protein n=1 Tax=unclassified Streptomyces TaxID=2593676 RepID=UPI0034435992
MNAALQWFKSSYSTEQGGDCLEVAYSGPRSGKVTAVHLRDSKNPAEPGLRVSVRAWAAFTAAQ